MVHQPDALETGGLYYPSALRAVFVSMYILEIFLVGLFFLLTEPGTDNKRSTTGLICGAIMAAALGLTLRAYHEL